MKPPVFLLGSGRCGSTLVQRVLNTYADVTIWGEHDGVLGAYAEQYFRLLALADGEHPLFAGRPDGVPFDRARLAEGKARDRWQAWLNWFGPSDLTEIFRRQVLTLLRPPLLGEDETWGFKEIRYGEGDRVIEFLAGLFPDAIFIFLVRDGFNTVASQLTQGWQGGWGGATPRPTRLGDLVKRPGPLKASRNAVARALDRVGLRRPADALKSLHSGTRLDHLFVSPRAYRLARTWSRQTGTFLRWHRSGSIRSFWVAFEDVIAGKPALAAALQAMGKAFGPEQQRVVEMGEGRGEGGFAEKKAVGRRWGTLGFLPLAVVDWTLGELNEELGYASPDRAGWAAKLRHLAGRRGPQGAGRPDVAGRATLAAPTHQTNSC
jgi:hypothetical protein